MALLSLLIHLQQITNSWKGNKLSVIWHIMEVALTLTPPLQEGAHFRYPQLFCPNILFYKIIYISKHKYPIVLIFILKYASLVHSFICDCDVNPNFIFREDIGKQKKKEKTPKTSQNLTCTKKNKNTRTKQKSTPLV